VNLIAVIRWFIRNLSILLLAFALAMVVWVSAVTAQNPNVDRIRQTPLEIVGPDPNMMIVGNAPNQVRVTLRAPRTVADRLAGTENAVRAWIDLSGLGAGSHALPVQVHVNENFQPVRVGTIVPELVTVTLEPLVALSYPVKLDVIGEPAIGYQKGVPARMPSFVTVSGPASLVSQVDDVRAILDITNASETIQVELPLTALDADGGRVQGITITPNEVSVTQPISLLGGYRNVVVKVVTEGQPADGYILNNLTVSPPGVLVFSTDPQLVADLPSFVETEPLDVTGLEDDLDIRLALELPEGVSVVGDESVLVQVSIAAVQGSLTIPKTVTVIGLAPGLETGVSPDIVDVIFSGPVPVLRTLRNADARVVVDVTGLDVGVYQLPLGVDTLPERVQVEAILPALVEVVINVAPTTTPTPAVTPSP
jgi:YbbR domain-containing protein